MYIKDMQNYKNIFENYLKNAEQNINPQKFYKSANFSLDSEQRSVQVKKSLYDSEDNLIIAQEPVNLITGNSVQPLFRPYFDKKGINPPCIGDHPDFIHLKETQDTENHYITTMFMDIVNSTGLGLAYPLRDVYLIKNAFISSAIDIVKSFDGHVHRIMGDAIMAYFGSKKECTEDSIINAINCATVLMYFVEQFVSPILDSKYPITKIKRDQFAIRIGLDYGAHDKVLWGCYGYGQMNEVTATSFHVDITSKLQHSAGRNEIMLGQSLKEHLDFPEVLLSSKPNEIYVPLGYLDKNNKPINYSQYLLNWKEYIELTHIPQMEKEKNINSRYNLAIVEANIYSNKNKTLNLGTYRPCSKILEKDKAIFFRINISAPTPIFNKIKFSVINNGKEALNDNKDGQYGNHQKSYDLSEPTFEHYEHLQYRGLHFLIVEICLDDIVILSSKFGVYIK